MGLKQNVGKLAASNVPTVAPKLTSGFVTKALHHAITGVGPLPSAAHSADEFLKDEHGKTDAAVHKAIRHHVAMAGAGGFVTNIGGLVTVAVTIPANITGLALIQCRLIAVIAHLRGYDLDDQRVRNAILVCMLGEDQVKKQLKKKKLPAPPMALATAPETDPALSQDLANQVATDLISRVVGKRLAVTVSRRVPVLGGVVGLSADGWATYQLGRYAAKELRARPSNPSEPKAS